MCIFLDRFVYVGNIVDYFYSLLSDEWKISLKRDVFFYFKVISFYCISRCSINCNYFILIIIVYEIWYLNMKYNILMFVFFKCVCLCYLYFYFFLL